MLASAVIVFREVIEAALVVSIVMVASRGLIGRTRWVALGIAGGIVGASAVALFADAITGALSGMGQELLNAGILFAAVVMLGWHNVWMGRHSRELANNLRAAGEAALSGARPIHALALVVGLAVMREGSEVVLFIYGIAASGETGTAAIAGGGALGLAGGFAVGAALYAGLLRIPVRYLFVVTGWLILLLAAGMAAQGARYLVQAGWLPALGQAVWDTSAILSERSIAGQILHTLIGYVSRPSGIQILFYGAALAVIGGLMWLVGQPSLKNKAGQTLLIGALFAIGAMLVGAGPARADHKVFSPKVEKGEFEFETRGHVDADHRGGRNKKQKYKVDIGYGVTDFWFFEVELEIEKEIGKKRVLEAVELENVFRLLPEGKYWLDLGFFAEYELAQPKGVADNIKFGPIFQKQFGRVLTTINTFFTRDVGEHSGKGVGFRYGWQTKYLLSPQFEPGFEAFGKPGGRIGSFSRLAKQEHQIGPVVFGKFKLGKASAIKYEAGLLFGLTKSSPDRTFKWLIEYEWRF